MAAGHPRGEDQARHQPGQRDTRPPVTTVTIKAGDTLSEIASAHGLTLKALLAFPENARYRVKPGLIHPDDIVRVK